ncbi:3-coathanger stack domain-containing protein [Emticicia agri]|uniref:Ig-like domain-containing protein n=1 Tax=Emticicia agri TaxID=2492393 RepID=A0A4Q5M5D2_9BACT|nr:3-coathanger stack domain-containing protein [Emticicia agri]RYU97067.1 hypothetical protein EWM59_03930 [Emticicia agri]
MKNLYQPLYQKILFFCSLLLISQLTFAQTPAPTAVTPNQVVCHNTAMSLTATCSKGMTKWYNASDVFLANVAYNYNATQTATYTVKCVYNAVPSTGVPVTITVNKPYNVTREQSLCHCNELDLRASCPSGDVIWYGTDTTTPLASANTFHIAPSVTTTYNVQCVDEAADIPCVSPFEEVTIHVYSTLDDAPTGVTTSPEVCLGGSLTLDGSCTGTAQPFYFLSDGVTEIDPNLTNLTTSATYKVRCESLDFCPSGFTDINVSVVATTPPIIDLPTITTFCKGLPTVFSASCDSGFESVWYENDEVTRLIGDVSVSYPLVIFTPSASGTYKVRCEPLSSGCNSTFESVTIILTSDITQQPASVLACLGDKAAFGVQVTGTPTFQWQKKQDNGTFMDITTIASATTDTLKIDSTTIADRGIYRCHVIGSCDFYTEEVFLSFPQTIISKNKLVPTNVTILDEFGNASAVSDSLAVVGAWAKAADQGMAFIYRLNPNGKWSQEAQLSPADLTPHDLFGAAVAISGDTVFVTAPGQDSDMGAVYIFAQETDGSWIQLDKITSPNGLSDDYFGGSISVSHGQMAVGADGWESVFIFKRDEMGVWNLENEIFENVATYYGYSVGLSGRTLVVGAPEEGSSGEGAIFIYEKDDFDIWQRKGQYTPDDLSSGAAFGFAAAISGNTIIASGYVDPTGESVVQVFERDVVGNWFPKTKLSSPSVSDEAGLGFSLAILDNVAVIGAPGNFVGKGAVVVFEKNTAGNWVEKKTIIPTGLVVGDLFGTSVAISKTTILGCASFLSSPFPPELSKGGAYFYQRFTYPVPVIATATQAAAVCPTLKGTFNLTGIPSVDPYTITYKVDSTGTEKTAIVTPDSLGNASFTETLVWANNERHIFITKIKNNTTNCQHVINVPAAITLKAPTEITDPPVLQTVCVGETAVFMTEATGEGILTFQWQRQAPATSGFSTPLNNGFSDISVLTLPNRPLSDNGARYRVKVTGECGVATSIEAVLTVLPKAVASISTGGPICSGTAGSLIFIGTPHAQVFYQSNGTTASTILDANGESVVSSGVLTEETSFTLVSINIGGKCDQVIAGTAKIEILASGTNPPLVLVSPTHDVLANGVQTHTAETIQASNKIESTGKTTNIGNKYVLMKPGFEAKQGSTFTAKITGACI